MLSRQVIVRTDLSSTVHRRIGGLDLSNGRSHTVGTTEACCNLCMSTPGCTSESRCVLSSSYTSSQLPDLNAHITHVQRSVIGCCFRRIVETCRQKAANNHACERKRNLPLSRPQQAGLHEESMKHASSSEGLGCRIGQSDN